MIKGAKLGDVEEKSPSIILFAIKKEGKRLYEYARSGEETKIESRKVSIYNFDFTNISLPHLDFEVKCSKGTYIRSLAHDFGKSVDSGAHLSALRRTAIGSFKVKNAITPEKLIEKLDL